MVQLTYSDQIDEKIKELVELKRKQKSKKWIAGKDTVAVS